MFLKLLIDIIVTNVIYLLKQGDKMLQDRIRELRRTKKLTQKEFAQYLNVSAPTIAMWETGKRTPDVEKVKEIGKIFNVSFDWLLGLNQENVNVITLVGRNGMRKVYTVSDEEIAALESVAETFNKDNKKK